MLLLIMHCARSILLFIACLSSIGAIAQPKAGSSALIIDTAECTCTQADNDNANKFKSIRDFVSYDAFQNVTGLKVLGSDKAFEAIEHTEPDLDWERDIHYTQVPLVLDEKLWITDQDDALTICINPCLVKRQKLTLQLRHRHDIIREPGWENFDVTQFDSSLEAYSDIVQSLYERDTRALLRAALAPMYYRYEYMTVRLDKADEAKLDADVERIADSLEQHAIDIDSFLYHQHINPENYYDKMDRDAFRSLQQVYADAKLKRRNTPLMELTKEQLDFFIHPHYNATLETDWVELDLNPNLLSASPPSLDSLLFGEKRHKARMLLHADGIVFDNEKGWQQANIPALHTPMSIAHSGLNVRIESLDVQMQGIRPQQKPIIREHPMDRIYPNGSYIDAWADLDFTMITAVDDRFTADTVNLGPGKLYFNNHELFGSVNLSNYVDAEADGIPKGVFYLDGERKVFDKVLFKSAIEAQKGVVKFDEMPGLMVVRFWLPGVVSN
ncbi:MAG: hypothetical protein Salg2KO_04170 [Salibacteraceae bacterium]